MYESYFDESGDFDSGDGLFCVSGYLLTSINAEQMDAAWSVVLGRYEVPYFHMVDCAHGNGVFRDVPGQLRSALVKELIALIKRYTVSGFSVAVRPQRFREDPQVPDPYTFCATTIMTVLQAWEENVRPRGDIAFFFESGHKHQGSAYTRLAQALAHNGSSVTFAAKSAIRLLQSADLLAWQTTKYLKDRSKRAPRKDFLSLMDHPHTLYLLDTKTVRDTDVILQVDWPESRRAYTYHAIGASREGLVIVGHSFKPKFQWLPIWTVKHTSTERSFFAVQPIV